LSSPSPPLPPSFPNSPNPFADPLCPFIRNWNARLPFCLCQHRNHPRPYHLFVVNPSLLSALSQLTNVSPLLCFPLGATSGFLAFSGLYFLSLCAAKVQPARKSSFNAVSRSSSLQPASCGGREGSLFLDVALDPETDLSLLFFVCR